MGAAVAVGVIAAEGVAADWVDAVAAGAGMVGVGGAGDDAGEMGGAVGGVGDAAGAIGSVPNHWPGAMCWPGAIVWFMTVVLGPMQADRPTCTVPINNTPAPRQTEDSSTIAPPWQA